MCICHSVTCVARCHVCARCMPEGVEFDGSDEAKAIDVRDDADRQMIENLPRATSIPYSNHYDRLIIGTAVFCQGQGVTCLGFYMENALNTFLIVFQLIACFSSKINDSRVQSCVLTAVHDTVRGRAGCFFMPESSFRQRWDVMLSINLLYIGAYDAQRPLARHFCACLPQHAWHRSVRLIA